MHDREEMLDDHGLAASLYSLRGGFVERLRALSVRIPLKLEGDDGLICTFAKWDLAPERRGFDDQGIVSFADAATNAHARQISTQLKFNARTASAAGKPG